MVVIGIVAGMEPWQSALEKFRAEHPEVFITYPTESLSGLWEVSMPETATQGFHSAQNMMDVLSAYASDAP